MTTNRTFILVLASLAVVSTAFAQTSPPPAGGQGGGGGRMRGQGGQRGGQRGGGGMYGLLSRPEVQTELKLTDDQKQKLTDAQTAMRSKMQASFGQGASTADATARAAAMKQMQDDYSTSVKGILSGDQLGRLKQIYLQQQGMRAVLDPDVQKSLALSSDQIAKIKALQANEQKANADIREKVQAGTLDRNASRETTQKNNQIMTDELGKILTADQKSKLSALGGAPFSLPPQQGRGGGRRGGGGAAGGN